MNKKTIETTLTNRKKMIKALQMIEEISVIKPSNMTELIFQQYAVYEGAVNAANNINQAGYRIKSDRGERKYISKDIIEALEDESNYSQVDRRILFVALGIKKQTSMYANWLNKIIKICDEYYEFLNQGEGGSKNFLAGR